MARYREEMVAATNLTATPRRELQPRMREQEMFEYTLREQAQPNRELLPVVQEEVGHNERVCEEAGQELEVTRSRAANEVQQVAHEAAEQLDARNRRLDAAAGFVRQLQGELQESREEVISQRVASGKFYAEYQAEQRRMHMGQTIYDHAVGQKEHELRLELEAA